MPAAKRRLSNLNVREIALCPDGMNPEARILLYKAREKPVKLGKEDDEPRDFASHYEDSRAMEIDEAIDRRLYALLHTTTEIMRTDVDDRADRILAAVNAYAATMERDVPELFAGRLAKWVKQWTGESRPSDDDVCAIVKSELYGAGLLPDLPKSGGGAMKFLKSLTERGQQALAFVLGDRDPAEFFKDTSEAVGELVVGLIHKAAETGVAISTLETELAKAKEPPADPNSLDSILKAITDPGIRAWVETQDAAMKKDRSDFATLRKSSRRKELSEIVKSCECLPNEKDALLDALEKADAAGILETIQTVLTAANAQARIGKAFDELGISSVLGEGSPATPDEAHEALLAKAVEIRKGLPDLTAEGAYEKACELNSDLYVASQRTTPIH